MLCAVATSLLANWIVIGLPAGALTSVGENLRPWAVIAISVGAPPLGGGPPEAPAEGDGAGGGGVALADATFAASHASKSALLSAWTSNSMIEWPDPHSSAH